MNTFCVVPAKAETHGRNETEGTAPKLVQVNASPLGARQ